jgi:hypothetical protein
MKSNIIKIFLGAFTIVYFASCSDKGYDDYDNGGTPTQAMNGEWFIDITDAETGDVYVQHAFHKTFDDNNGQMFISDRLGPGPDDFSGWYLESRVNADVKTLTFSAADAPNLADGSIVNITDGKIFKNAAHSRAGNVVDSIYFKGQFDYDPGTILIFAGHKRTGFLEDEY